MTYTGSVPLNLLSDKDSRIKAPGAGERDPIWFLPRNEELLLQFLAQPTDFGPTGFYSYREAQTEGILLPGSWSTGDYAGTARSDLPWHLRDVPVQDVEILEVDGAPRYRYKRDYLEVTPGNLMSVTDDIVDARKQRFPGKDGRVSVEWQVLVPVIVWAWPDRKKKDGSDAAKPEVGSHILLKITKKQAELLTERLIEKMADDPTLDITEWKWHVTIVGGQPNKLILKRGERLEEPLEYEPYDAAAMMSGRRQRFEEHVCAAFADYAGLTAAAVAPDFVTDATEEPESDELEEEQAEDLFDLLTNTALRGRLKKAGVAVPPGSGRDTLVALAHEHLT